MGEDGTCDVFLVGEAEMEEVKSRLSEMPHIQGHETWKKKGECLRNYDQLISYSHIYERLSLRICSCILPQQLTNSVTLLKGVLPEVRTYVLR